MYYSCLKNWNVTMFCCSVLRPSGCVDLSWLHVVIRWLSWFELITCRDSMVKLIWVDYMSWFNGWVDLTWLHVVIRWLSWFELITCRDSMVELIWVDYMSWFDGWVDLSWLPVVIRWLSWFCRHIICINWKSSIDPNATF